VPQCRSYGDPVLERRRPGGSDLAIIGQGSQAYLSLPSGCVTLATKAQQIGPCQGSGLREDERDVAEIDESRGKLHSTRAFESRSGDGVRRWTWEPGAGWKAPRGF